MSENGKTEKVDFKHSKLREKNIIATIIIMVFLCVLSVAAYMRIYNVTEERCLDRMEEATKTVMDNISNKLQNDSVLLNAVADIIAEQAADDEEMMQEFLRQFSVLTTATQMNILLPDNYIISMSGRKIDASAYLDFEKEAALGEHVTDRMVSIGESNDPLIRHFVPIVKDGEVIAMLYSTIYLKDLPSMLNLNNIYGGTANTFIVDRRTGDLLMDTVHEELNTIDDFNSRKVKSGSLSMEEVAQEIKDGKSGYTIMFSETQQAFNYFYYMPISENDWHQLGTTKDLNEWTVAVTVPEDTVLESALKIRRVGYIVGALELLSFVIYLVWTLRNTSVTMEKAILQERLVKAENAERAKTMFLSNMSHDIRTPMNAIIGYTTLAAANTEDTARVKDYLSKILSSSNHLLSLINDILDMSRIESGRVDIEETQCSLPEMLGDLRNILLNQMHSKKLNFYIDTIDVVDEDIYCDKLHLNQVLLNLLSNAVKFTPEGGSVSLIIKQKHGAPEGYAKYEIRVKDTGIGMDPAFIDKVFDPFEREATSTVSGIQGTGLGMAIAKNIIDMMGGTIEVVSEQGKGTEYILDLDFRLQTETKQIEVIKELEGMRALVVDDDYAICDSVTKMLVQLGLRADWTMSGKEAVLHARQAEELGDIFNAYIIDLYLPDINGIEVVRQIRREIGDEIPIIILTAYDWTTVEHEAREAGVTAFCNKPIFVSTLRETLVSALGANKGIVTPTEEVTIPSAEAMKDKKLLLVEDNELNREIAIEILTESGLKVDSACDGTEAVEIMKNAQKGDYDLILMDVQMPVMDGYEATKAIRALDNKEVADIPIVAMTANAFDEDKRQALESGMNDHIAKPLDMDKLFDVLHKFLG